MIPRAAVRELVLTGVLAAVAAVGACTIPRDPIVVEEGMIMIENQTPRDWRNVKVTVNYHYSGGTPLLQAGGRLTTQVSQLQTAFGQKFDRGRQSVFKVEVTATDTDGKPVSVVWGHDQKR
jgi:hypothetical protein